jgi:hypothetical protein
MMGTAKHIGRIGALAVALGVGMAAAVPMPASASDVPPPDSTALIVCGTTCPKFDAANGEIIMNQFIKPTHQGQNFDQPIAVTTPNEAWPLTGVLRIFEFAIGDPRLGGPGGPAWPDEPLWKLSGLFDLTGDQSIEVGAADLEAAMAANPDDHLVVYGYSQGGSSSTRSGKSSPRSTREPRRPISISCWQVTSPYRTAALVHGSRASTSLSSSGPTTGPS